MSDSEAILKPCATPMQTYMYRTIGKELSSTLVYFEKIIHFKPIQSDHGYLLDQVENENKVAISSLDEFEDISNTDRRYAILLAGNLNYDLDIQTLLSELYKKLNRFSRLIVVSYNPYFSLLYKIGTKVNLRQGPLPKTFLTTADLDNLCALSSFEVVRNRLTGFCPLKIFGIGDFLNKLLPVIPLMKWTGLAAVSTIRPIIGSTKNLPSLSILIPARNERGNIENALKRIPNICPDIEILFVEGHSSDGTWEEIQRVSDLYSDKFTIHSFKQMGKGKADAVRLGFSKATSDLLTILDADLTMPPEQLEKFYNAYVSGIGDFVNGSRLLYPMESEAMRFLNKLGNVFFAKTLSMVLNTRLTDSLCGTKLFARKDYERMIQWRTRFGDFDPFGDFELLFPATILGLGIIDLPIRYRNRVYGSTQISRFRHGLQLLRMTIFGFFKIALGR